MIRIFIILLALAICSGCEPIDGFTDYNIFTGYSQET